MSDASRYRRIYANEWHDPAFRALDDGARIVRLYVSAGPQTTSCGCFRLSTALAVEDLGGTGEDFERRLDVVCEAVGWRWDRLARVIWITNWFDMNPPASPNVVQSWAKLLKNVPDCDVKTQAITSISKALKNLPATFREPWIELSKIFARSESQPQSQPETNHGSGIRDQGSGNRGTGALTRDGAVKKSKDPNAKIVPEVDARVLRIAQEVIRDGPKHAETEYLIDVLKNTCRQHNLEVTHLQAMMALVKSQSGLSA